MNVLSVLFAGLLAAASFSCATRGSPEREEGGTIALYEIVLEPEFEAIRELRKSGAEISKSDLRKEARDLIKARLGLGTDVLFISSDFDEPLRIRLRGKDLFDKAKEALGVPHPALSLRMVEEEDETIDALGYKPPEGAELLETWHDFGPLLVKKRVLIEGARVHESRPTSLGGQSFWSVVMRLDEQGAQILADVTRERVGQRMAIVLGGKILSAPEILEPILGGDLQIDGAFTRDEAVRLSNQINSALVPPLFEVIEERALSASATNEN